MNLPLKQSVIAILILRLVQHWTPVRAGNQRQQHVRAKMSEVLDRHGVMPDHGIDKVVYPGLEATKTELFTHQGRVIDIREAVDQEQRGKYADRVFKLVRMFEGGA